MVRAPRATPPMIGASSSLLARAGRFDVRRALVRFFTSWRACHYALILCLHAEFYDKTRAGAGDWYLFAYPWADAIRRSIGKYHEFPWWNPWSISGEPLFAEPQIAILTPDTLFALVFGSVLGLKLLIVFYVLVGYEGTRFLCRELFGPSRLVDALSVIPILLPTLALHFNEGHMVFLPFYFFPWLLAFALTWERSAARSVGLGVTVGLYLLSYIHYTIIMSFTIAGAIVLYRFFGLVRKTSVRDLWLKAVLVGTTAMALAFVRVALALAIVRGFPRGVAHYPIFYSPMAVLATLIEPLQNRDTDIHVQDLSAWEMSSYIGLCALLVAYEGFRQAGRRLWALYAGAAFCLVLAWNNRDWYAPSYWLHVAFPWKAMQVIPRWSIFADYFLLIGAVQGLRGIYRRGQPGLATVLALVIVADLGFHITYGYRGMFAPGREPESAEADDPPKTVGQHQENFWPNIRKNVVTGGAVCPLLGMTVHRPSRSMADEPGYRGEFYGSQPVSVESWSPNRIVLHGTPGDHVTINVNPSNYWTMNGVQLFPEARAFEVSDPFVVTVPPSGRMELLPRPPHVQALIALQVLFAAVSLLLARFLALRARRPEGARDGARELETPEPLSVGAVS